MANQKSIQYQFGMFFIVLGVLSPLLAFLVPVLRLPTGISATLIGILIVGAPEVFLIIGVALAGKEAANAIKTFIKNLFHRDPAAEQVSERQYNIGLVIFFGALIINWIFQYVNFFTNIFVSYHINFWGTLSLDIITLIGFFILGPQFYDKIRALFVWENKSR